MNVTAPKSWILPEMLVAALGVTGCDTHEYVDKNVAAVDTKIQSTQSEADQQKQALADHDARLAGLDRTSREALERAMAAGKLAEGKFLYSMVLQDDGVKFNSAKYKLTPEGEARLNDFVSKLKADNKNVYLEIQGHTNAMGAPGYNEKLGEERAEAVRMFLNQQGVALNRIGTISYGETAPVASNKTRVGRAENRRVLIVVLA